MFWPIPPRYRYLQRCWHHYQSLDGRSQCHQSRTNLRWRQRFLSSTKLFSSPKHTNVMKNHCLCHVQPPPPRWEAKKHIGSTRWSDPSPRFPKTQVSTGVSKNGGYPKMDGLWFIMPCWNGCLLYIDYHSGVSLSSLILYHYNSLDTLVIL